MKEKPFHIFVHGEEDSMFKVKAIATLCVSLCLVAAMGCASPCFSKPTDAIVHLKSRKVVMLPKTTLEFMRDLRTTDKPALHALVELTKHPSAEERAQLMREGVIPIDPLGGTVYYARVAKTFELRSKPGVALVRNLSLIRAEDKETPNVRERRFEAYRVIPSDGKPFNYVLNADGTLNLSVRFFALTLTEDARTTLKRHSARDIKQLTDTTWLATLPQKAVSELAAEDEVQWIDAGVIPPLPENDSSRERIDADNVQQFDTTTGQAQGIGGDGVDIGIFDTKGVDEIHGDLVGRVIVHPHSKGRHATHVAGTAAGNGAMSDQNDSWGQPNNGTSYQWRGMAPEAELISGLHFEAQSPAPMDNYVGTNGLELLNASVSVSFNGDYNFANQGIDELIRGDALAPGGTDPVPPRLQVYSAGNHGQAPWNQQPFPTAAQIGYFSLTKQMKNAVMVGNFDLNTNQISQNSSLGPTYDGRIKPDVVAPGMNVKSAGYCDCSYRSRECLDPVTVSFFDCDCKDPNTESCRGLRRDYYRRMTGTSMASPVVTGTLALVLEQYATTYGVSLDTDPPLPSTLRAILVNTAEDIQQWQYPFMNEDGPVQAFPGPDFVTGFGMIDAVAAVSLVENRLLLEDNIEATCDRKVFRFYVDENQDIPVRVTLAWDDIPSAPGLAETAPKLINDLDLVLIDPEGNVHYPWLLNQTITDLDGQPLPDVDQICGTPILVERHLTPTITPWFVDINDPWNVNDPIQPDDIQPAKFGKDHLNNVEQVVAEPIPGFWTVEVSGFSVPQGPQPFSLAGFNWTQPRIEVSPRHMDFGKAKYNETERVVTILNTGTHPLHISSIATTTNFRLYHTHALIEDCGCGSFHPVIDPGSSCGIVVKFAPRTPGIKRGQLRIASDDPNQELVEGQLRGESTWILKVTPESINFGEVKAGQTSKPRFVNIRNVGSADGLEVHIAPLPYWYFAHNLGGLYLCESFHPVLDAGAGCNFWMNFTPPARGVFRDEQVILSIDPDAGTLSIPLKGRGI